eukprot:10706724-Lingulodinium_polyedra.AAC.1
MKCPWHCHDRTVNMTHLVSRRRCQADEVGAVLLDDAHGLVPAVLAQERADLGGELLGRARGPGLLLRVLRPPAQPRG